MTRGDQGQDVIVDAGNLKEDTLLPDFADDATEQIEDMHTEVDNQVPYDHTGEAAGQEEEEEASEESQEEFDLHDSEPLVENPSGDIRVSDIPYLLLRWAGLTACSLGGPGESVVDQVGFQSDFLIL